LLEKFGKIRKVEEVRKVREVRKVEEVKKVRGGGKLIDRHVELVST
jgi:hypothetical protein